MKKHVLMPPELSIIMHNAMLGSVLALSILIVKDVWTFLHDVPY